MSAAIKHVMDDNFVSYQDNEMTSNAVQQLQCTILNLLSRERHSYNSPELNPTDYEIKDQSFHHKLISH